jgi:tRNA (cytidine56-2'-O)-methyltransferase
MSTHLGLVARAFGAKGLVISGMDDETIDSLRKVSASWGGYFLVEYVKNWRDFARKFDGVIIHLTMYGEQLDDALPKIQNETKKKILVVVGGEKVPGDIYKIANYNVSIGNQPHSELAALAVFLDRLFMGEELYYKFENARLRVIPKPRGKGVENLRA